MITIIHGDDIVSSRKYFQEKKQEEKESITLEAAKMAITDLAQAILGSGLFGSISTIFIEDLLTKLKEKSQDSYEIVDFIIKNHKQSNIFLWESKEIQKRSLSRFKEAIVKSFRLPKNIFIFLDSLRPNNFQNVVTQFHKTLNQSVNEELIFFMLQRQFRLLLALSQRHPERSEGSRDSSASSQNDDAIIDEIIRLAPWQKGKLVRQARLFSPSSLKDIYTKLYAMEVGVKTGTLDLTLVQSIDFLLYEM